MHGGVGGAIGHSITQRDHLVAVASTAGASCWGPVPLTSTPRGALSAIAAAELGGSRKQPIAWG
eukprot:1058303-Alexandrium_andersonii.AAC.1